MPDWSDTLANRRSGLVRGFIGNNQPLTAADTGPEPAGQALVSDGQGGLALTKTTIPVWSPPNAVLTDQFERTSANSPGAPDIGPAPWVPLSGTWGTDGHNLDLITHGANTYDLVAADVGLANVVVAANLTFAAAPDAGLAVRVIDANNFWAAELVDSVVNIFKVDAGVATQMATVILGRTLTDVATTNLSPTVTSATANFTAADVGQPFTGTAIPAGTFIKSVTNTTTAALTANATATGTNRTEIIGTSTKSGTHSVKVCADLDTIGVMVDSVQVLAYDMSAPEWAKYQAATQHGAFAAGSAEGTLWRRIAIAAVSQRGFYNGRNLGGTYSIGRAATSDGREWFKRLGPVLTSGAGGSWDSGNIIDPWVIQVAGTKYLFYDGTGAAGTQIGVATSLDWVNWTKNAANPIVPKGPAGGIDENNTKFAVVVYDPDDADAGQRWKMWFTGFSTGDKPSTCYAYSPDGINWTKWVGNPVLDVGLSPYDFDNSGLSGTGVVFKIGRLWHLLSGPFYATGNMSITHSTFTDPKSRYAKDPGNPVGVTRRVGQLLTADLGAGSQTVLVADTAVFVQGEPVVINTGAAGTSTEHLTRIQSIDSPTQLTIRDPALVANFTVAAVASIRSVFYGGVTPRALIQLATSGRYRLFTTSFAVFTSGPHEVTTVYDAASPIGPYTPNFGQGVVIPPGAPATWDQMSAENISVTCVSPS